VPRISAFYCIVISISFRDHGPPHFHAVYGEHEVTVAIDSLSIIEGALPGRAWRLVLGTVVWGQQADLDPDVLYGRHEPDPPVTFERRLVRPARTTAA
jgi:hypothetical protein